MTVISGDWFTAPDTRAVCDMLTGAGHQALFVGGCVRNALLGVPVADVDIATDARPERVIELARAAGLDPVPTGIEHGTITVVAGGIPHEVTTFRKDVETDGRRAVVAFSSRVEDDAHRRDFTMNALYATPDGAVVDPLGGGLADLRARRVRFIDDADQRIREDYLRILRYFRFHAHYGDAARGMDREALSAIAEHAHGLDALSSERITAEFLKLLAAPDPAPALAAMRACGVLTHILPGGDDTALAPLVHLEGDAPPDPLRRLAALGGEAAARLRLSKRQARRLANLREAAGSPDGPATLGYRHGEDTARDILLIRAASLGQTLADTTLQEARAGAAAIFPVAPADLMPAYRGKALGDRLKALEALWIASGFTLTRDDLLSRSDDLPPL
ncbi:poly(A) polymerase [Salinihabitans flavidus]|uniref:Poly(A) polymerase n=1 Tax=Salinihabitans flavidus TaxID=569882 RepID=A0A1H8LXM0_9RHOB|nr:CCA tRNA nucleotidyltransferase [Salinihabitans flavidus]SEO09648.1 poly(A) polymerase [Salinihabitans flavidus]